MCLPLLISKFEPAPRLWHGAKEYARWWEPTTPHAKLSARERKEGVMRDRARAEAERTADLGILGAWPNAIELIIRSIKQG